MFGVSMTELLVIAVVVLVVVGPQKLPSMLRTLGQWIRRLQQLSSDVRHQTGIDELLRAEGIEGLDGLRSMLRGDLRALVQDAVRTSPASSGAPVHDPYAEALEMDRYREYPPEGVDAAGALPDDLVGDVRPEPPSAGPVEATAPP